MADFPGANNTTDINGYDTVLTSLSFVAQNPSGLDVPLSIVFGAQENSQDGSATIGADGVLTINESSFYNIKTRYRFGRSGASGTSNLFNWAEISFDGGSSWLIAGSSIDVTLRNSNETDVFIDLSTLYLQAGTKIRAMFARSSTGDNSGGLVPSLVSAPLSALGVPDAPSAQITVYRMNND